MRTCGVKDTFSEHGYGKTKCGNVIGYFDDKWSFCPFCGRVLSEPSNTRYLGVSTDIDGVLSCFEYNHQIKKGG